MPAQGTSQIPTPVRTGKTPVSGLPSPTKANSHAMFSPTPSSKDPLNRVGNRNTPQSNSSDVRMDTAKGMTMGDVRMETARATTYKKGAALQLWEKELLDSSEVKRKATVAQLCLYPWFALLVSVANSLVWCDRVETLLDFLDYYFQTLGYIAARKERRAAFDEDTKKRNVRLLCIDVLMTCLNLNVVSFHPPN